jgi:hypothetical protein
VDNKFYGIIGNIKIIYDGNFLNTQEKNYLLNKIKNSNINNINIDLTINYGILSIDDDTIRKFIQQIKKIKNNINIMVTISIYENNWDSYLRLTWLKFCDIFIINLKILPYLITNKEKIRLLNNFYNINDEKIIVSDNFLDLEYDIIKKYSQGVLLNSDRVLNKDYGIIILNGLNFYYNSNYHKNFWENILFQKYDCYIHCTYLIGWQPLEILHSSLILNDNQLKLQIIEKIKSIESFLENNNNKSIEDYYKNINGAIENLLQKTNDLLYDINN